MHSPWGEVTTGESRGIGNGQEIQRKMKWEETHSILKPVDCNPKQAQMTSL